MSRARPYVPLATGSSRGMTNSPRVTLLTALSLLLVLPTLDGFAAEKAAAVMALELLLRELGGDPAVRDPDLYAFSILGEPSAADPWGWRMEGHHVSFNCNFTGVDGVPVAWTPEFAGANPAPVRSGSRPARARATHR